MKERIQHSIDRIRQIAGNSTEPRRVKTVVAGRPNNVLSQSIRNAKEAAQFNAELKAAVTLSKMR